MEKSEIDIILESLEKREEEFKSMFQNILNEIDDIQKSINKKENENEQ